MVISLVCSWMKENGFSWRRVTLNIRGMQDTLHVEASGKYKYNTLPWVFIFCQFLIFFDNVIHVYNDIWHIHSLSPQLPLYVPTFLPFNMFSFNNPLCPISAAHRCMGLGHPLGIRNLPLATYSKKNYSLSGVTNICTYIYCIYQNITWSIFHELVGY